MDVPRRGHAIRLACGLLLAALALPIATARADRVMQPAVRIRQPCLAGEFERQQAVLISWCNVDDLVEKVLADIVQAVFHRVQVLVLVPTEKDYQAATAALTRAGVVDAVEFLQVRIDTIWVRDYGPATLKEAGGNYQFVDSRYGDGDRANDDAVPSALGVMFDTPSVFAPLVVEGGNLISNGQGVAISTKTLIENNRSGGYDEQLFNTALYEFYGIRELVHLERLEGEPTGHVDMFATFVDPQTVVVGQYDPAEDPLNAAILDRNAERLAQVRTPSGPLRVVRIPMPTNFDGNWRTYTNVLFANGVLVVPVYPGVNASAEYEALRTYESLLPGWKVVGVDCTGLIELSGAIHCVTQNLCGVPNDPLTWKPALGRSSSIREPVLTRKPARDGSERFRAQTRWLRSRQPFRSW